MALPGAEPLCFNLGSPRWQLVYDGQVEVSIQCERQRTRDGSGAHHQYMGTFSLGAQLKALHNPETMLLISDAKTQLGELDALLDQGVSADGEVYSSRGDALQHLLP